MGIRFGFLRWLGQVTSLIVITSACGSPSLDANGHASSGGGGAATGEPGDHVGPGSPGYTGDASTTNEGGVRPGTIGAPITCSAPGNPTRGGSCGSERWNIKTGTDSTASSVSLVPQTTTIATLDALAANGAGTAREAQTESTLFELKDVTLTEIKLESDSDYHLVISQDGHTMIIEVPAPSCSSGSAWSCFISRTRSEIDAKYSVGASPQYPAETITVRGIGFFDYAHGQTGVAPNAIEIHPVLQICFGAGCTPT